MRKASSANSQLLKPTRFLRISRKLLMKSRARINIHTSASKKASVRLGGPNKVIAYSNNVVVSKPRPLLLEPDTMH